MQRILVTGSTGNLGRAVVAALESKRLHVRAAARHPSPRTPAAGVEAVCFDYENPATHPAALQGVDALVLIAPPLDHSEVAAIVSRVSGRPIAYHAIAEDAMLGGMRGSGMPEGAVQYAGVLYAAVWAGYTAVVTRDVEGAIGRPATAFEAFARRNVAAWT